MRRIIAPAAVAFALLAIASCSADVKDFQEQGEKFIEGDQVRERFGMVRMGDAECQEPASTDEDTTYTCTATGSDGNTWGFTIEISGTDSLRIIAGEVVTPGAPTGSSVPVESSAPTTAADDTTPASDVAPASDVPTTVAAAPPVSPVTTTPG